LSSVAISIPDVPRVALDAKQLLVDVGLRRVAAFDLTATLDHLKGAAAPAGGPPPQRQALMLEAGEGEGAKTRLAITFLSGNIAQPEPNLQLTAYLILPPSP
jgi:hypothetical protein